MSKMNPRTGAMVGMFGALLLTCLQAGAADQGVDHQDLVVTKQLDASSTKLTRTNATRGPGRMQARPAPAASIETVTIVSERIQRVSASAPSRTHDGTSSTVLLTERVAR